MPDIRIESILGGHSPSSHFASPSQFRNSLGIDPGMPISDDNNAVMTAASGLLRPVNVQSISGTVIQDIPLWMVTNPKDGSTFVYDARGSAYVADTTFAASSVTAISDGGSLGNSSGNGLAYYDNYIYFAKNTTIARYGPLDGTPGFDGDYWVSTIGQTAMVNTTYPNDRLLSVAYRNHPMHRHSDGRLYIGDVVGNLGTIHYISTSFTSAEGDTNNSSTFDAVHVGYGLWPICMESYGSDLVIAFYEGRRNASREMRAKIAFWDTASENVNKIVWVEFPDQIVTAMKNINGVLYVMSGNLGSVGFRVSRFVGGYTFEEVAYFETGEAPFAGAVDGTAHRLLFGSATGNPEGAPCVFSIGLNKRVLGDGIFNVMRPLGTSAYTVTSLLLADNYDFGFWTPIVGRSNGSSGGSNNALDAKTGNYDGARQVWWSQVYRIGQPFLIKRIRIPLAQAVAANMTITPTIYFDDNTRTQALTVINNTNFPNSQTSANIRVSGARGDHNFWLELIWTGSSLLTVGLPIIIEYDLIPD